MLAIIVYNEHSEVGTNKGIIFFEKAGRRYGLLNEFHTNGII